MKQESSRHKFDRTRLVANVVAGLQLSWQAAPAALLGVAGLAVLSSVIPTAEVWLSKRLVDGVVSARRAAPLSTDLWLTVAVMGLLAALQRALSGIEGYRRDLYTEWVRQEAELRLAAKTASVDLGRFDDPDWHDRMARAGREVGWRTTNLAYTSIGLGGSLLTLGGLLGLLLAIGPALVGLALLSVLPVLLLTLATGGAAAWLSVGAPPDWRGAALLPAELPLAWLLNFLMSTAIGLLAFVAEDTTAFEWIYNKLLLVAGGVLIPLDFFPEWLRGAAGLLPFASTTYTPAHLFVRPDRGAIELLAVQVAWIGVLGGATWALYRHGLRRLVVNGG